MNHEILDRDPSRPWTIRAKSLPRVGEKVEVWTMQNRAAEQEDEHAFGRWHAAEGTLLRDGHFQVGPDRSAIVSHWRPLPKGPVTP